MRKHILTPTEAECFEMLESLTQEPVEVDYRISDRLAFFVNYEHNSDPMFVMAVMEAVKGRLGERFIELTDLPEVKAFKVIAKYDEMELPDVIGSYEGPLEPDERTGRVYCRKLQEITAVQVEEENIIELERFCGGGEMHRKEDATGTIYVRFSFRNNGVLCDDPWHWYICKFEDSPVFVLISPKKFEQEWEPK